VTSTLPRIYVVRHGETEWSLAGRHTGRTDLPLTAPGEAEARENGRRLHGINFSHVLTSPRQRARRTCDLAMLSPAAEIDPDLAEWDYGDYEGKVTVEIHRERPGWNLFRDGCPHGESPAQVGSRADRLFRHLQSLGGNIALFTHGHFGRVLAARWIGLPARGARGFLFDTASLGILDYEHGMADSPVVAAWNIGPGPLTPAPANRPPSP
jgi:probable phosphoglycerate mutase